MKRNFPLSCPNSPIQVRSPGVAESQITSPADQSQGRVEGRASLAYPRQPTRSPELRPPDAPDAGQSEQALARAGSQ